MKGLQLFVLNMLINFCCSSVLAQTDKVDYKSYRVNEPEMNKPKLFQNQLDDIPINPDQLKNLLHYQVGQNVSINLSPGFLFEGQVVSTASKYENSIQSVVIASSNFNGARLTLSRLTHSGKGITYTGRIISFQHGDLFELVNRENQYYFVKKKLYDLISE